MQQLSGSIGSSAPATGNELPATGAAINFVINLCASTSPAGLEQPDDPALQRFKFFVSRRREDGRERFRLHMGFFPSQEAAEQMLGLVRDVYPAAWAGVAPGLKLRARTDSVPPATSIAAAPPAVPAQIAVPAPSLKLELVPEAARTPAPISNHASTATHSLSDVRAAINSLGDAAPVPAPRASPPGLDSAAVLRLLETARPAPASRLAPRMPPVPRVPPERSAPVAPAAEPVAYAVQLHWSVQAIDLSQVPQLAIFAAYTLYGVEGNRDGRRWYGLRLGFFTDAVSAKQVAQYVRSEFTTVSIVPVTVRERERAGAAMPHLLPAVAAPKRTTPELNFIEDTSITAASSGTHAAVQPAEHTDPAVTVTATTAPVSTARPAAAGGKRAKLRVAQGGRAVSKRPRRSGPPQSLEETLEVLGAGQLQMDTGRGELINDVSQRERPSAPQRNSRFGRLIARLAVRLGEDL
jgi:hypothetical protein